METLPLSWFLKAWLSALIAWAMLAISAIAIVATAAVVRELWIWGRHNWKFRK